MPNIVEVAQNAGNFSTLVSAVQKAGLVDTLSGSGPFTVFAPTDDAFNKLDQDVLNKLLDDTDNLKKVLTYHVVADKVVGRDVAGMSRLTTVEGSDLSIDNSDGVKVDEATVTQTDIMADNGVIHAVDTVILPERFLY